MNRDQAVKELKETFLILDDDVRYVRCLHEDEMSAFHVRMTIRTYAALIEGLLYQLRQVALSSEMDNCTVFNFEERMMLGEKSVSLNAKGEVKEKDNFVRALPMLLFTLKQYAKIHGAEFSPDTSIQGWECMKQFITIRNRIVHPKSKSDLRLTKEEWDNVNLGVDWFYSNIKALFAKTEEADEYYRSKIL